MQKIYLFLIASIALSCSPMRINYIGNSSAPTQQVDVYVTEASIKKPYDIVGRGFMDAGAWSSFNRSIQETMQKKAIEKARKVGADAVLFQEYILVAPGTNINTIYKTDTIQKGVVTVGNTTIGPNVSNGMNIFFLKYNR
jgi:hypothetical protein